MLRIALAAHQAFGFEGRDGAVDIVLQSSAEAADARRANAVLEIQKDRVRNLRPRESLAGLCGAKRRRAVEVDHVAQLVAKRDLHWARSRPELPQQLA